MRRLSHSTAQCYTLLRPRCAVVSGVLGICKQLASVAEIVDTCLMDRPTTGDPRGSLLWADRWAAPLACDPEAVLKLLDTLTGAEPERTELYRRRRPALVAGQEIKKIPVFEDILGQTLEAAAATRNGRPRRGRGMGRRRF